MDRDVWASIFAIRMNKLQKSWANPVLQENMAENHEEQWFDPKEGLELMTKYTGLVKSYHSLCKTSKMQCLYDLESYKSVLETLNSKNMFWRFSCDL